MNNKLIGLHLLIPITVIFSACLTISAPMNMEMFLIRKPHLIFVGSIMLSSIFLYPFSALHVQDNKWFKWPGVLIVWFCLSLALFAIKFSRHYLAWFDFLIYVVAGIISIAISIFFVRNLKPNNYTGVFFISVRAILVPILIFFVLQIIVIQGFARFLPAITYQYGSLKARDIVTKTVLASIKKGDEYVGLQEKIPDYFRGNAVRNGWTRISDPSSSTEILFENGEVIEVKRTRRKTSIKNGK